MLDEARSFESGVGTVFVERLERAGAELDGDVALEFGHPDALLLQIRQDGALDALGDVTADAALLLRLAAAVNVVTAGDADSCDLTNSGHKMIPVENGARRLASIDGASRAR